jgi:3-phenylpropionate/trans-cinnamate dioxygenase ferredoxin component
MDDSWVDVGAASEASESTPLAIEVDGIAVVVVRCAAQLYAVEDRCTHDGEPLGEAPVEDCQIICPRHGSRFCLRTGEALTPPAYEPLHTYTVREHDGRIELKGPL